LDFYGVASHRLIAMSRKKRPCSEPGRTWCQPEIETQLEKSKHLYALYGPIAQNASHFVKLDFVDKQIVEMLQRWHTSNPSAETP
jgi:hypothetical protein